MIGATRDQLADLGPPLEPATIRAARSAVPAVFRDSPQFVSESLSQAAGVPVVVKVESVNPIGSFKGRGTWLAVRHLVESGGVGEGRPLVVASTGNFGQGCAWAGRAHGIPVVVFADRHANPRNDFDEARLACAAYAASHDATLLVDGREPWIATGAGGVAVELTDAAAADDLPALDAAFVPVGNGSLIVGIGAWLRHAAPACRVVGVQAEGAPSMALSWRAGRPIETERAETWAAGIASRVPVPEALDEMRGRVDDMVLVSDDDLRTAQAELTAALGITVEGGGAASWAAINAARGSLDGPVLVLVTGSNAEPR